MNKKSIKSSDALQSLESDHLARKILYISPDPAKNGFFNISFDLFSNHNGNQQNGEFVITTTFTSINSQ